MPLKIWVFGVSEKAVFVPKIHFLQGLISRSICFVEKTSSYGLNYSGFPHVELVRFHEFECLYFLKFGLSLYLQHQCWNKQLVRKERSPDTLHAMEMHEGCRGKVFNVTWPDLSSAISAWHVAHFFTFEIIKKLTRMFNNRRESLLVDAIYTKRRIWASSNRPRWSPCRFLVKIRVFGVSGKTVFVPEIVLILSL